MNIPHDPSWSSSSPLRAFCLLSQIRSTIMIPNRPIRSCSPYWISLLLHFHTKDGVRYQMAKNDQRTRVIDSSVKKYEKLQFWSRHWNNANSAGACVEQNLSYRLPHGQDNVCRHEQGHRIFEKISNRQSNSNYAVCITWGHSNFNTLIACTWKWDRAAQGLHFIFLTISSTPV